jgi:predicted small metal-binding protein
MARNRALEFIDLYCHHDNFVLKYHHNLFQTMLSVNCHDVGVDCDFKGSGETAEELMNNLVEHAIKDHGYTREDVMKPEMQEKIKGHFQKS